MEPIHPAADELDEAVRSIHGAAAVLRGALLAAQAQVQLLTTELAESQRAERSASERAAALAEALEGKQLEIGALQDAHAQATAEAHLQRARAAELEQLNVDLQRVSRVVALQNENARLREEVARLTTQPPAAPRRRTMAVARPAMVATQ